MRALAIDYGDARTGFSISDPTGLLATSLTTYHERGARRVAEQAAAYVLQFGADRIVLGMPKNMNNTLGKRAEQTLFFRDLLHDILPDIPIILWDERSTTISATAILNETNVRGKKRKNVIDTVAASVILQSYLDSVR